LLNQGGAVMTALRQGRLQTQGNRTNYREVART
jgi:hypothetical protein